MLMQMHKNFLSRLCQEPFATRSPAVAMDGRPYCPI